MITIKGDTYSRKDALKAAGARWDSARKAWTAADDAKGVAKLLVQIVGPTFRADADRDEAGNILVMLPRSRQVSAAAYDRLEAGLRSGKYGWTASLDAD